MGLLTLNLRLLTIPRREDAQNLVDNRGYSYNIQRRRGKNTDWQCTVRPKVYKIKIYKTVFNYQRGIVA